LLVVIPAPNIGPWSGPWFDRRCARGSDLREPEDEPQRLLEREVVTDMSDVELQFQIAVRAIRLATPATVIVSPGSSTPSQ
jgi:hypothetical protein